MDMNMIIHFGEHEIILFRFWKTGSFWGMTASMVITCLLCLLYEALKGFRVILAVSHNKARREQSAIRSNSSMAETASTDSAMFSPLLQGYTKRLFSKFRVFQAVLYGLQALLAYVLMLIVMTFNGNLILSVVVGEALGYFLFTGTPLLSGVDSDCSSTPYTATIRATPNSRISRFSTTEEPSVFTFGTGTSRHRPNIL